MIFIMKDPPLPRPSGAHDGNHCNIMHSNHGNDPAKVKVWHSQILTSKSSKSTESKAIFLLFFIMD